MEGLHILPELLQAGEWMVKMDLQDVLVPCSTGDVGRLPQNVTNPIRFGHDANRTRVSNARGSPTTDCLAHLRGSYSSQGLSDEASKLMLSSWRTSIMDHPLLSRIIGVSNGTEIPILGWTYSGCGKFPVTSLLSRLPIPILKLYRSAISSAHDPVDGVSVGLHPTITRLLKGTFNTRPPLPR